MRRIARALAVSGVILTLLVTSAPARADHDYDGLVPTPNYDPTCFSKTGPTDGVLAVCQTDNADVYWYADSADPGELEDNDVSSLRSVLSTQYSPTDLAIHYDSSPVFSGDAETDVIFQEAEEALPLPSGILGVTWCNGSATPMHECDQTYIRIASPDGYRLEDGSVVCHEMGHAVGLVHGNNAAPRLDPGDARLGCMANEDDFPAALGAASRHLINITY